MVTLNKIKAKLEKEAAGHLEAKAQLTELTQQLTDLSQLVRSFCSHPPQQAGMVLFLHTDLQQSAIVGCRDGQLVSDLCGMKLLREK